MTADDGDAYLSRRESDILIQQGMQASEDRVEAHRQEHAAEAVALGLAMAAAKEMQDQHNTAHESAHVAHHEKHASEGTAVKTALAAVATEREIHAKAHEKEHDGHQREHGLNNLAIDKAESANDKRFSSTNAYREQLNEMIRQLAPKEALDVFVKDVDRRFEESRKDRERRHEELRHAISALERTDVKAEGKGIGQGAVVAYIVTAIGLVGSVLAIVIVLSNALTTGPV